MCIMRTTVAIDDQLLQGAKARARDTGRTLGQLVEDALRRELARPRSDAAVRSVRVYAGVGGVRPGIDVTSNRALLEALDDDQPFERLR